MAAPRLRTQLALVATAVSAILLADSFHVLPDRVSMAIDDAAQLIGGGLAAACCFWTARRRTGIERAWRRPMAVGMAGWSVGQLIWSWYQVFAKTPLPSPSWADVGYLTMPVFGFLALLAIAAEGISGHRRRTWAGPPKRPGDAGLAIRSRLVLLLDGLVVVGSLLVLTWATALGAVVRAGAPTRAAFVVAIAYPATDLVLVVMVTLLLATRPLPPRLRPQLALLGLGLIGLSVSDSIFAYLVASGADRMPPVSDAGFVAGPTLIVLAALARTRPDAPARPAPGSRTPGWAHTLLPYLPLAVSGTFLIVRGLTGERLSTVEVVLGVAVVALVVLRQIITLVDNQVLLERVSEAQRRLHHQAHHDPLSGLPNRALFRARLAAAVERGRRDGHRVLLFFIDLDDFKLVNDGLGHGAGDLVLHAVGTRLNGCVRARDMVARLGGDEFGVLVEEGTEEPERIGERIVAALREPFTVAGRPFTIGASVGAATADGSEPALTADTLLHRADAAMYAGKRRGKGMSVTYGAKNGDGYDDAALPALLAEALSGEPAAAGLDVHYQPIVRIADGRRLAFEALARWTDPVVGPVPAPVFVALAEHTGLIGRLDDFVLDRACRDLAGYLATSGEDVTVHVNVSASRFGEPEVEATVRDRLVRHGLAPDRLVLEITESTRIPDIAAAAASAGRLRGLGIRLALDDFGTGYSTLALLRELPLDIIKLDRSLTDTGTPDVNGPSAEALCRAVVSIATEMGIMVVAEGVETAEQAAALGRVGCRYAQGHRYGRPEPFPWLPSTVATADPQPTPPDITITQPAGR